MGFFGVNFNQEIFQRAINLTGGGNLLGENFQNLSSGEKQRVMFAKAVVRTLATNAKLLLLDEPFSNADIKNEIETIKIVKTLANCGTCVLMINHNIKLAMKHSHSFLLLKNGEVLKHSSQISKEDLSNCFDVDENYL